MCNKLFFFLGLVLMVVPFFIYAHNICYYAQECGIMTREGIVCKKIDLVAIRSGEELRTMMKWWWLQ